MYGCFFLFFVAHLLIFDIFESLVMLQFLVDSGVYGEQALLLLTIKERESLEERCVACKQKNDRAGKTEKEKHCFVFIKIKKKSKTNKK